MRGRREVNILKYLLVLQRGTIIDQYNKPDNPYDEEAK